MFSIIVKVALRELKGSITRSLLTMLGVIIGVAAVVAMVALGEGAKRDISNSIQNLGANLLIVKPGLLAKRHVRRSAAQTLTVSDAKLLRSNVDGIASVAPSSSMSAQIKYLNKNTKTNIIGVTPDYLETRKFTVASGRFFTNRDVAGARRVAALGIKIVNDIFGGRNPIGKYIKINGVNFLITCVMSEKGQAGWWDADDQIMIPISTFQKRLFGMSYVQRIYVEAKNSEVMEKVTYEITRLLNRSHGIRKGQNSDFHVRSQVEIMQSMDDMTQTFTLLLGGIAAISLVVGGIGIMNIMLVTVTERTREIGLRKAMGAKRKDILKQFLVESTILTGCGGIIGIFFGFGVADVIGRFSQWDTYVSPNSVIIAYGVALLVGVFFGWWPAYRASKLNPVEALRHE
tara:strand:+ start:3471 stop:4676 length:1206 start_codon:yes stop_codon:yes gene_type:complete